MPDLSIKNVPEDVAKALRQRAARNHRSLQDELLVIIHDAVQADELAGRTSVHTGFEGRRGTRTIEAFAEESRRLYPEPVRDGPMGVDIIRADRDSR